MSIKIIGIDNDIKVTDQIRFMLSTTNSSECLGGIQSLFTPYKINQVTIYFISRDFTESTVSEYTNQIYDKNLISKYEEQKVKTCSSPTAYNLNKLNALKVEIEQSKKSSSFFFKEAIPVKIFGGYTNQSGELFPAWINPEMVPSEEVQKVERDNLLKLEDVGKFLLEWNPVGCREGDYFICWNWTPNLAGSSQSAHMGFRLLGNSKLTNSIPTHYTIKDKYEILLDRYLPDMFKNLISDGDLTPMIMQELNNSVAKGFTFIEDMANQIIDLLDSNSTQEQLLPLLSNTFNLRLKSYDPILWRRQIKKAIPNFKKKGTLGGLKSALSDAGMRFLKLNKLWQVSSKYTHQEHFEIFDSLTFKLSKNIILPIQENNFNIYYKLKDSEVWVEVNSNYIDVEQNGMDYFVSWIGNDLEENAITLSSGDVVRILYQWKETPNLQQQELENYIKTLDLMDQRNERDQQYPPKNWNTRLIEEDDPLFDVIVPIRHPIQDYVVWGKVRTEFPYSENVYNMEEYNGSTRDSFDACDISKDFIDPCFHCQSSKLNLDVEVEELSDDRIVECSRLVEEFVPFHSLIHSINFLGCVNEFVKSPIEEITALVSIFGEEVLISGEAQHIFNRSIPRITRLSSEGSIAQAEYEGLQNIKRTMLSQMETAASGSAVGYNTDIVLFCPSLSTKLNLEDEDFIDKTSKYDKKNINYSNIDGNPLNNSNLLEIFNSPNAGNYSVQKLTNKSFKIVSGSVPESSVIDKSQFEFRISNKIYNQSGVSLQKDNLYFFKSNYDFNKIKIITKKESANCYKIKINEVGYGQYNIVEILPDGRFILEGNLPDTNVFDINWELLSENDDKKQEAGEFVMGSDGSIKVNLRALVNLNHVGSPVDDIRNYAQIGDYILYDENQYKIKSFIGSHEFYVENFQGSVGSSGDITIYRRIIENCVGQLDYMGLVLETEINYETSLPVQNETQLSQAKQNYLILINSEYYSILDIDGTTISLEGPKPTVDWTTHGTNVNFTIYNFINKEIIIPDRNYPPVVGHTFTQMKRSNNEVITKNITTRSSMLAGKILNSINSGTQISEVAGQDENINFTIEYKDGKREEKNL